QGGRQHVAHRLRPVRLEQGEVRVNGAGHRERELGVRSGPGGNPIEAAATEHVDGGGGGRRALPTHRGALAPARVVDHGDALAAEGVRRRRLHDGGGEAGGGRRVEGVAAA